jgi:hypothetical protein
VAKKKKDKALTLPRLKQDIEAHKNSSDPMFSAAFWALSLMGLALLPAAWWLYGWPWYGLLAAVVSGFLGVFFSSALLAGVIEGIFGKRPALSSILGWSLASAAVGAGMAVFFEPAWVGLALGALGLLVFPPFYAVYHHQHHKNSPALRFSKALLDELLTSTDGLHKDTRQAIELGLGDYAQLRDLVVKQGAAPSSEGEELLAEAERTLLWMCQQARLVVELRDMSQRHKQSRAGAQAHQEHLRLKDAGAQLHEALVAMMSLRGAHAQPGSLREQTAHMRLVTESMGEVETLLKKKRSPRAERDADAWDAELAAHLDAHSAQAPPDGGEPNDTIKMEPIAAQRSERGQG